MSRDSGCVPVNAEAFQGAHISLEARPVYLLIYKQMKAVLWYKKILIKKMFEYFRQGSSDDLVLPVAITAFPQKETGDFPESITCEYPCPILTTINTSKINLKTKSIQTYQICF